MQKNISIGDSVTCKRQEEAYYSDYGVNKGQACFFTPDDTGKVAGFPPNVTGRNTTFVLVVFGKHGRMWQVALDWNNVQQA